MQRSRWRAVLGVGLLLFAARLAAEDCLGLVGGWWHGPARVMAAAGDTLYYATVSQLVAMDASDPLAPQPVGSVPAVDFRWLAGGDGYVYGVTWESELYVFDVEPPGEMREVGRLDLVNSDSSVVIEGDRGYISRHVIDMDHGWVSLDLPCALDLSDPSAPAAAGCLEDYRAPMAVDGDTMYAFDAEHRFVVLDVTDLEAPTQLGRIELGEDLENEFVGVSEMAVTGTFVVMLWSREYPISYLTVVDVSDRTAPTVASTYDFEPYWWCRSMVTEGDRIYFARSGVEAYRLAGDGAPELLDPSDATSVNYEQIALGEGVLYALDHWKGLVDVYDISQGAEPVLVRSIEFPGPIFDLAASRGSVVASERDGLRIFDISDPAAPREVGSWQTEDPIWEFTVASDYAYVWVTGSEGDDLVVVDLSDPARPGVVNVLEDFPGYYLKVFGGYAYARNNDSVSIFDLEDPTSPELVASLEFPDQPTVLNVVGQRLYVSTRGTFYVVDVSVPTQPVVLGEVAVVEQCCGACEVHGPHAYVMGTFRLLVIDVGVPTAPQLLRSYPQFCGEESYCTTLRLLPRDLLLANQSGNLVLYDLSDPLTPSEVAVGATSSGADVLGSKIFVPAGAAGMAVYDLSSCPGFVEPQPPRRPGGRLTPPP